MFHVRIYAVPLVAIFLLSLSCFLPANLSAEENLIFIDSIDTFRIITDSIKNTALKRMLKKNPDIRKKERLFFILDSLGYFDLRIDTVSRNTFIVSPNDPALIDSIIVTSGYFFTMDSCGRIKFPIPYDAGLLQGLARQSVAFLANRGYPFAQLDLDITFRDTVATRNSASRSGTAGRRCIIHFTIETQKKCYFDEPVLLGNFQTKNKIILRDIILKRGEVFDEKKVAVSRARLAMRPYITQVRAGDPAIIIGKPDDGPAKQSKGAAPAAANRTVPDSGELVGIPFFIQDKSGLGIDGSVGYNSTSESHWSGLLTITLLNVLHKGEQADLNYRGEKDLQQFDLSIAKPFPFLLPVSCAGSFGLEIQQKQYGYLKGSFEVLTYLKALWQAGISIKGHETTVESNQTASSWFFYGVDFILKRDAEQHQDGMLSREFVLRTGTGFAERSSGRFTRWHVDILGGAHIPVFRHQAVVGRIVANTIKTDDRDTLHQVEKNRVGGSNSIRGYAQNQFPFTTVAYVQTEYHYYFNRRGSVYIFVDGGFGFPDELSFHSSDRIDMMGYGAGIGVPVKIGRMSIAWARNYQDRRELGRIHVGFTNALKAGM